MWAPQAGEQQVGVLATLQRQLAQLTGEGEDLSQGTKSYRQSIFKLNHKINKLNVQVPMPRRPGRSSRCPNRLA